jgi:hypothetical protein
LKKKWDKKEKFAVKIIKKMLPVLAYSFEMPILILSLLFCQFLIVLGKCHI